MGARKPGPMCATNTDRFEEGVCPERFESPLPLGLHPIPPSPHAPSLHFAALWAGYPAGTPYVDRKTGHPPPGFDNQCAIRLSVALHAAGVPMESFRGAYVLIKSQRAAVRAEELAAWLKLQALPGVASAENVTGEKWQEKIKGRTGIVFFANYWARPGETKHPTGDHIDLWNGNRLTISSPEGLAVTVLRFGLGVTSGPGFSDLGKATSILFWEIR